jgi:hypothetical protein
MARRVVTVTSNVEPGSGSLCAFTPVVAASLHITACVALIDDQQRRGAELGQVVLAYAGERRVGEFFEERMCLAIDDTIALLDGRAPDRLGEMAFAGAGRAEKQRILTLGDEARGGKFVDERAIHFLVEIEIKIVEGAIGVAKARQLVPALEETVLSPVQFIRHERDTRSIGTIFSAWAWCNRVSRTAAMPDSRSCRRALSSSTRFIPSLLFCDRSDRDRA